LQVTSGRQPAIAIVVVIDFAFLIVVPDAPSPSGTFPTGCITGCTGTLM